MQRKRLFILLVLIAGGVGAIVVVLLSQRNAGLYRVTVLPSLGGGFVFAEAINDRGQIAGTSTVPGGAHHLFLWDRRQDMQDLGPADGPADINNEGQICATAIDPNGRRCAFVASPDGTRRWLGTLGGSTSIAMAINNRGQVVGESWTDADINNHAFIWDGSHGMQDVAPPDVSQNCALAVNDRGRVLLHSPQQKIFLWDPNEGFLLVAGRVPGALFSFGEINSKGQVALASRRRAGRSRLMISNGTASWRTLLELDGDITDVRLNDANQVLFTRSPRPLRIPLLGRLLARRSGVSYLWDPNKGLVSLNSYVPRGTGMRLAVRDLNNKGCIVGFLFDPAAGNRHYAVLLEPVPERWGK